MPQRARAMSLMLRTSLRMLQQSALGKTIFKF